MKSHANVTLLDLAECLLQDIFAKCAVCKSDQQRDLKTIRSRVKHEGISFLTLTLPTMGNDLDRSLANSNIDTTCFRSLRKYGRIPAFLRGIFCQVFDPLTGRIRNDSNPEAIECLRQIAYAFKKLAIDCSPAKVQQAIDEYKSCELDLYKVLPDEDIDYFSRVSLCLWDSVFYRQIDFYDEIIPKHGPGATAERISGNQKYVFRTWHERLEPYFPLDSNISANCGNFLSREFQGVKLIPEEQEMPVRVITVPKTLKGPRIIAIEPVCMQYTQQGLSTFLVKRLESSRLTRGHVNFTDQRINQKLAIKGSIDGSLATLDLSSASDRVPASLVYIMLSCNPDLRDAAFACRSNQAQLPSKEIISLKKFASMGSALCFPIESMYFYTICVGALLKEHNLSVTYENILRMSRMVYVYGDDIIVPSTSAAFVAADLQKYYCKVGTTKSFWTGKFRESCGTDAFSGYNVTPTYIRKLYPRNKRDTERLISWTKTSNQLYLRGYWKTSAYMIQYVERHLGSLPLVGPNSPCLGKISFQNVISVGRWNKRYQRFEVKGWVVSPCYYRDALDGYPALLKSLLILRTGHYDDVSVMHLLESARHGTSTLKCRWTLPY